MEQIVKQIAISRVVEGMETLVSEKMKTSGASFKLSELHLHHSHSAVTEMVSGA